MISKTIIVVGTLTLSLSGLAFWKWQANSTQIRNEAVVIYFTKQWKTFSIEQKIRVKKWMGSYIAHQYAISQPIFPILFKIKAEEKRNFKAIFSDLSNIDHVCPFIIPALTNSPYPDATRRFVAIREFLKHYLKLSDEDFKLDTNFDKFKESFAQQNWKVTGIENEEFYFRASEHVKQDKTLDE